MAIYFAILSCFCAAVMVVFDRVMVNGCYGNRPNVPWYVSSFAGIVLGIPMTLVAWTVHSNPLLVWQKMVTEVSMTDHWLMFGIGSLTALVMRYYFILFKSENGEEANETGVAMWLAAAPIFIFVATKMIFWAGLDSGILAGLREPASWWALGAVALAVLAIWRFETLDDGLSLAVKKKKAVVMMLFCIVAYSLLLSSLLGPHKDDFDYLLALQPVYWLGYGATGLVGLCWRKNREDVAAVWDNLYRYRWVILTAEAVGALVYLFEVQAFHELRPEKVNLIIGSNVVIVFTISVFLGRFRRRLEASERTKFTAFGVEVETVNLPATTVTISKTAWLSLVIITLGVAIAAITTP